jgi:hypothetical protein
MYLPHVTVGRSGESQTRSGACLGSNGPSSHVPFLQLVAMIQYSFDPVECLLVARAIVDFSAWFLYFPNHLLLWYKGLVLSNNLRVGLFEGLEFSSGSTDL